MAEIALAPVKIAQAMRGAFGWTSLPPRPLHPGIGKKPIGVRRLTLWLACVRHVAKNGRPRRHPLDPRIPGSKRVISVIGTNSSDDRIAYGGRGQITDVQQPRCGNR